MLLECINLANFQFHHYSNQVMSRNAYLFKKFDCKKNYCDFFHRKLAKLWSENLQKDLY